MPVESLSCNLEYILSKLHQNDLNESDDGQDDQENGVLMDSLEYVELVVDLSGSNHVENLHEHKGVEHHSVVSARAFVIIEFSELSVEVFTIP